MKKDWEGLAFYFSFKLLLILIYSYEICETFLDMVTLEKKNYESPFLFSYI